MSFANERISFYVYNDLRAQQNGTGPEGNTVTRFDELSDAIAAYNDLPKEWTSAIGVKIHPGGELDLVQRTEGENVLSGDFQRIPDYYTNPYVREAASTLVDELDIQYQSDYRVFGSCPVLFPIAPSSELDQSLGLHVRDRFFNGKQLCPDDPHHLVTSIRECFSVSTGWRPFEEVWKEAKAFGYDDPHKPKISALHVRYADEKGRICEGDMNPYNFALLMERTKIMEGDKTAIRSLAKEVEHFISSESAKGYAAEYGAHPDNDPNFVRCEELSVDSVAECIDRGKLQPLVQPMVEAFERGMDDPGDRAVVRELLSRVMSIPEEGGYKMPLDLRMRANAALEDLFRQREVPEKTTELTKAATKEEGR